jgi:hypothetical protein
MEKEFTCITYDDDDDVDIIDVPLDKVVGDCESMGGMEGMEGLEVVTLVEVDKGERREKGEKCGKEIDNSKPEQSVTEKTLETTKPKGLEIELLINATTCDEVIFKKHVVEIIDKVMRGCVIQGVVERYEIDGRVWDPDIVLVFEDGRRFCNDNFGYMFRYYL